MVGRLEGDLLHKGRGREQKEPFSIWRKEEGKEGEPRGLRDSSREGADDCIKRERLKRGKIEDTDKQGRTRGSEDESRTEENTESAEEITSGCKRIPISLRRKNGKGSTQRLQGAKG